MFKVGDKIINFNKAYIIYKITKQKSKIENEGVISFKPYFQSKEKRLLTFSIPIDCLNKTHIRKPISKEELKKLLSELGKTSTIKAPLDIDKTREQLSLSDLNTRVQIIKRLWKEKNDTTSHFTKSKEDILAMAIKLFLEEVALVSGISLEKAEKRINLVLKSAK